MAPAVVLSDGILAALEKAVLEDRSPATYPASTQLSSRSPAMRDGPILVRPRSTIRPRGLSKGGTAGVVVGCIVAVFLVGICLYPFIVRRLKRRKQHAAAPHAQDPEVAQVAATPSGPSPFTQGAAPQESGTHQSSRDSLSHKDDSLNSTAKPSSKDDALDAAKDDETVAHDQQQERGAPVEHENILPRNYGILRSRDSDVSLGTHPRWNTEGPPPLSPGGIELVDTRADGLEYSEAMAGQSASYYSPTVPSEAFGMATPPSADEGQYPGQPRSLSRGSSLKHSLMSMMRRMSSKDNGKASPASGDRETGPWIPPSQHAARAELSESPVLQDGPSFRDFGYPRGQVPRLGTPVRFPMSPASTADTGPHDESSPEPPTRSSAADRSSPPILPPTSPPPGTVNPMDIMAPSNQSEHVFHTDRELYYLANPHVSPPRKSGSPSDQPESQEKDVPPAALQALTPGPNEEAVVPKTEPQHEVSMAEAPKTPAHQVDQDTTMTTEAGPARTGTIHLTPAYHGHGRNHSITTSEGNWTTDMSDRSTPLLSQMSSMPSHHNTPNTQLTEISPSPRSDLGSDIRSSASPSNGATAIYTCDECHRGFDQIHKLNHHRRYHERPHECPHANCDKRFGTKTHLDRHINDKHKKTRKFHCLEQACPYSRAGGKGFPRKDNWRRHMINKHGMSPSADPEPDIADDAMGGM